MTHATETLTALGIPFEVRVVSAHRTPDLLFEYAGSAVGRGLEVLIAGAGGAAHLPGMTAAKTRLPVHRRSGAVARAAGHRLAAVDRADAARHSRRDRRDRQVRRRQRGAARRRDPRQQASRDRRGARAVIAPSRRPKCSSNPIRATLVDALGARRAPDPSMTRPRVGIVGAGQLGRMLALAGYPLGIDCTLLDHERRRAGRASRGRRARARSTTSRRSRKLADEVDVVTLEIENVAVAALESLRRPHRRCSRRRPPSRPRKIGSPRRRCSARSAFRPRSS